MKTYLCEIDSTGGYSPADSVGGPAAGRERKIEAESPQQAAAKAARKWQREREFFANESSRPAVIVDGEEYVPSEYWCPEMGHERTY